MLPPIVFILPDGGDRPIRNIIYVSAIGCTRGIAIDCLMIALSVLLEIRRGENPRSQNKILLLLPELHSTAGKH